MDQKTIRIIRSSSHIFMKKSPWAMSIVSRFQPGDSSVV